MGRTARCGPLATLDGIGDPITQTQTAELVGFDALTRTADGGVLSVNQAGRVWRFDDAGTALWARSMEVSGTALTSWHDVVATAEGSVLVGGTGARRAVLRPERGHRNVQWSLTDGWTTRTLAFTTTSVELTVTDQGFGTILAAAVVRP